MGASYPLAQNLQEDVVWRNDIVQHLKDLLRTFGISGVTVSEMLNNAI